VEGESVGRVGFHRLRGVDWVEEIDPNVQAWISILDMQAQVAMVDI
jgi:hypothetical protein